MSIFVMVKIIHIITMCFFIGVVGFRTFIFPALAKYYDDESFKNMEKTIGKRARAIISVNNIFLILSGLILFSTYHKDFNLLLTIKAMLGFCLASLFYFVPFFINKYKHIKWFNKTFHHGFFSLMILTVVLSQLVFL